MCFKSHRVTLSKVEYDPPLVRMDFLSIKHFGDSELEENQNELIFRRKLFIKK